jgi:hypothetical protein
MRVGTGYWRCAIGAALLAGCQQGGGDANNGAGAAGNAANVQASAPAAPAAPAVDPASQTGPVALASDSSLPAPCQTIVREVQTCIDNLSGNQAGFREGWLRSILDSNRGSWASAHDDSYRGPLCEQHLDALHSRTATWNCGIR